MSENCIVTGSWNTSTIPDGFTVSPSSGSGNTNVTVTASDNTSLEPRGGKFNITYTATGGYALTREVTVSQSAFKFNNESETLSFDALAPGSKTFNVVCSGAWTISGKESWLTLSQSEGDGNLSGMPVVITVTPSDNTADSAREAELTISSKTGGHTKSVKIQQVAGAGGGA